MSQTAGLVIISSLLAVPSFQAYGQAISKNSRPTRITALQASISRANPSNGNSQLLLARSATTPVILAEASRQDGTAAGAAATAAVQELLPMLNLPASAVLEASGTVRAAQVWRTSFGLQINGIPVRDRGLRTTIGAVSGKLMSVTFNLPSFEPNVSAPSIDVASITTNVTTYLGDDKFTPVTSVSTPALAYVNIPQGQLRLAYQMNVRQAEPAHAWRITVDAITGRLLEKKDMLEYFGGDKPLSTLRAKLWCAVHLHSPFDTLVKVGLPNTYITVNGKTVVTDSNGYWTVDDTDLDPSIVTGFYGPSYHVQRHDGQNDTAHISALKAPYYLLWNDHNSNAAERDAFYHLNRARYYLLAHDTGLKALDTPLTLNVNMNSACNAFYDADNVALNFFRSGGECNNTGEIADIIYHEFGHRVAAIRYASGPNGGQVNSTLAEAFADLVSTFIRDDPRIGIGFYQSDRNKVLRNCDNTLTYPANINADVHINGEIISGAFWDLRKLIGHDTAERLFHAMEWLVPDGPEQTSPDVLGPLFINVLLDVLAVDDNDNDLWNGTPHESQILQAFSKHGIDLASLIQLKPGKTLDQDTSVALYYINLQADYDAPVGALDPQQFILHYTTDNWNTYSTSTFYRVNDSMYQDTIAKLPAGTIVSYYITAALNVPNGGQAQAGSPVAPMSFMIGFKRGYYDNCESDRGWSLSLPTDNAVRGKWTRDVPFGTYNIPGHYVQQDTDHTPDGTKCYVTGNLYSQEIWADCVDSGTTTLTTNSIDLGEARTPILRYWYYYSNDQWDNPGVPQWLTQISGDGGIAWKNLQQTNLSTSGWTNYWFRVSDYVTGATHVKLRFIASNTVHAVVEAGIDDVELLASEAPTAAVSTSASAVSTFGIHSIYPNPAFGGKNATVQFGVTSREHITLVVKNVAGDVVARPLDEVLSEGPYSVPCFPAARQLAPGIYWVVLTSGDKQSIRKLVIE